MLATYRSCGVCWDQFGAECWQVTGLMGVLEASAGLYVGNSWGVLELAWGCMLETYRSYGVCWGPVWGCMLATCGSYGACWSQFEAVSLHVFWGVLDRVCCCMLATYRSYGVC